jgi:hypothetical protein
VVSTLLGGYSMRQAPTVVVLFLVTMVGCVVGSTAPPPVVKVSSPNRGLVQGSGQITVKGTALPGADGAAVTGVTVNRVSATLAADGSFTAIVDVPAGATLLETVASSETGGTGKDVRAVQVGQLRSVGTSVERAITASLSTETFAKLSAAAGPIVKSTNLMAMLAPLQPMASLGDDIANLKLSITNLTLGDVRFTLTPVDGGLAFTAQLDGLSVAAKAAYGGIVVPNGTTTVGITADRIQISGTLVVTPAGTNGFTTKIASPTVQTTALRLQASGLAGQILALMNNNLASTVKTVTTRSAELALAPLINQALGALAGPQRLDVLGQKLELQASPSAITFTRAGALVTMNLQARIAGSEASPGYIFTPNGVPTMNVSSGIQLGLADDLVNQLLAQVHALGLLDIHLDEEVAGLFDSVDIKLSVPPMISASTGDDSLRLVLGDMIATFKNDGETLISAAINAQVDLAILRGTSAQEIALKFGAIKLFVNVLGENADGVGGDELSGAATGGIGLQLESLEQFLITVPVPSVAGVALDNLSLRGDSGYVLVSGQVH